LDIYWNILKMHGPINVKSPNNISEWQMGFNSAFKGLMFFSGSEVCSSLIDNISIRVPSCSIRNFTQFRTARKKLPFRRCATAKNLVCSSNLDIFGRQTESLNQTVP
jgi:hypothetical protein